MQWFCVCSTQDWPLRHCAGDKGRGGVCPDRPRRGGYTAPRLRQVPSPLSESCPAHGTDLIMPLRESQALFLQLLNYVLTSGYTYG